MENERTAKRLSDEHAISPDNGRGVARLRQRNAPSDVFVRAPMQWKIGFVRNPGSVWPAPLRPVFCKNESGDKAGMRDPRLLVETVVYDAELTMATPLELWLSTGIRALDHAVEGFLSPGEHPFNDVLALEGIRRLFDSLPRAKASPADVDVRTENQLAAWFSFTLPGPSAGGLSHTMGKQIGARHGIPHGVTSCLLLPHVMRHLAKQMPERMAILSGVMGGDAADRVQRLIESLGLPQHIAECGIGESQLRIAAEQLGRKCPAVDLLEIYKSAL